jgi:hypothetical protein
MTLAINILEGSLRKNDAIEIPPCPFVWIWRESSGIEKSGSKSL